MVAAGLMTVPEVAVALRIGRSLAYRLCTDGTIPAVRIASVGSRRGRLVVRREDVDRYVARLFRAPVANVRPQDVDALLRRVRSRRG